MLQLIFLDFVFLLLVECRNHIQFHVISGYRHGLPDYKSIHLDTKHLLELHSLFWLSSTRCLYLILCPRNRQSFKKK